MSRYRMCYEEVAAKDLATPRERCWLDRLARLPFRFGPYWIRRRTGPGDGEFTSIAVGLKHVMMVDYDWLRSEVRSVERKARREAKQEALSNRGAYI